MGAGGMDIRLPMGLMFSIMGAIIAVFGFMTQGDPMYAEHSLGLNVNLCWGAVMFLFGVCMLLLTWWAASSAPKA